MTKDAATCNAEYNISDWGATWNCERPEGHPGWHTDTGGDETYIYSRRGKLKERRHMVIQTRWKYTTVEKYNAKTDTFEE